MRYISVCSGIEAATVAWEPLGWEPVAFSEIEAFPSAVLEHHYPDVPNLGDMTALNLDGIEADVLVGGTPCQAFSVAGLRKSLDDDRGNLSLRFVEIADELEPDYVVWENVPGVLSTGDNAFGCFLGALAGSGCELQPAGARWTDAGIVLGPRRAVAWRCLDAQYFGLAQRRKRVFVVACPRDGGDPAAILFESEGVRRDTAPSREAGERTPEDVAKSIRGCSGGIDREDMHTLIPVCAELAPSVTSSGPPFERTGNERMAERDSTPNGGGQVAVAFNWQNAGGYGNANEGLGITEEATGPLQRCQHPAVAFKPSHYTRGKDGAPSEVCPPLSADADRGDQEPVALTSPEKENPHEEPSSSMQVRRLTPIECEKLQGFPVNYTQVPWRGKKPKHCPDGPRYRALGNSMAVPVMAWIGRRIECADGE